MQRTVTALFLLTIGLCSVHAQDMIILKDGNVIQSKVVEISPSEIRYKRFDNVNGPMIVIPAARVLSIRYENGVVDVITADPASAPAAGPGSVQTGGAGDGPQLIQLTPLQRILNALPAIPIAGNNLKFEFIGDTWTTRVNGENFSAGTIEIEDTDEGCILTLKQTHIWPGAVGKTAGRVANMIPGGGTVGGVLTTAGNIAGAVGAVEAPGPEIVLEYKAGPPAKLSLVSTRNAAEEAAPQTAGGHPLTAENRFDLDGFNVFALSLPVMWAGGVGIGGGGLTITVFEKYKPGAFFTLSYFLAVKYFYQSKNNSNGYEHSYEDYSNISGGIGVLFKHRFRGNRVLWNFGPSLEVIWVFGSASNIPFDYTYQEYDRYSGTYYSVTGTGRADYDGGSTLLSAGIQTGFSFRFNPYTSLDLNGLIKLPFGTVYMKPDHVWSDNSNYSTVSGSPPSKSFWPFTYGVELGITTMFPYRSRR